MGKFKEDQQRRDLLISAFYERKQYRDNWIWRIKAELIEQREKPSPEKSTEKMEIALEAWRSLHPVIERYHDAANEWDRLHFSELWEVITKDRDLSNVVYNGILHLKGNINQRRDSAGLLAIFPEMKIVSPIDSKDYQEWNLLNELEDGLHEVFRQDQPQQTGATVKDQAKKYTKKNTAKEAANVFFDKHVGDDNSIFAALRVGKGKGKHQEEFPELWELFKKEHSEITQKEAITRDSFKTYLNNWRQKKVTTEN